MAKEILAKIELVRSVVMSRIEGLEASIADLEAQVEAGLGKPAILAALASLKAEAMGILPEPEPTPETEGVDVGAVEDKSQWATMAPVDDDTAE